MDNNLAVSEDTIQDERIRQMFAHPSKLLTVAPQECIEAYKQLYMHLRQAQQSGRLPVHENYLNNNELATNIYKKKYFLKDLDTNLIEQTPEDTFVRLAAFMAAMEPDEQQRTWAERFYNHLYEGYFLPGGRVIAGAGDLYRLKTLANCFVSLIDKDNIEGIYKAAYECARTYSYGGGIGVDISCLRPKGSVVHNAADHSTGAVSFMEIYSLTTGLIGQSGRRGALMLTLDVKHPDVMDFINVKKIPNWVTKQIVEQCKWSDMFDEKQLAHIESQVKENTQVRFANISLKVSDEFMQAVDEQKQHGPDTYLVYKRQEKATLEGARQSEDIHYSYGIPSKPIEYYEHLGTYNNAEELAKELQLKHRIAFDPATLEDESKRDVFGDYIINTDKDYDLAVRKAGDFLLYFNSKQTGEIKRLVKAREVWNAFVEGNYQTAEPGLIFWTTMTKYSPSNYVGRPIASTNPCGEVPLEDGGACNLGSVNLSRFVKHGYSDNACIDWDKLKDTTQLLVRFLDNVVSWNESLNALDKQRTAASKTRRLGLGIMGIADMLNQLGVGYDSEDGVAILKKISAFIADKTYEASALLAKEKAPSPVWDYKAYARCPFFQENISEATQQLIEKHGLRNIAILSIAPTGTISNVILGYQHEGKNYIGVSGGIEPIFALYYTRRSESFGNKFFKVFHSTVQAYIDINNLTKEATQADDAKLRSLLPEHFFRTAHHIKPEIRIDMQGIAQKYIDHSISSTVNLPEDIEPETISNIYLRAWKEGLKGITIYRDGSRYPILSVEGKKTAFQEAKNKKFVVEDDAGNKTEVKGDHVLELEDGSLTTIYHVHHAQN